MKKLLLLATAVLTTCVVYSQTKNSINNSEITILENGVRVHKTNGVEQGKVKIKAPVPVRKQINELSLDECLNSISYIERKIEVLKMSNDSENDIAQYKIQLEKLNRRIKSIKTSK